MVTMQQLDSDHEDFGLRFWSRNGGGRIYKITGFAFGNLARKRAISVTTNPVMGC